MVIVPTSRIILLKNPIEIDYSNELTFASKEAQFNYFYNLPKLECDQATYQRKDEVVRFPTDPYMEGTTYDDLIQYNYCMYQNDKWSDKWFYAFIKNVTFDNPGMSYIEIETDVWQSWCFDITFKNSFIEREHVNNDTIGLHTIPENLETGDYISCKLQPSLSTAIETCFAVGVTELLDNMSSYSTFNQLLPIGLYYIGLTDLPDVQKLVGMYDEAGKGSAINSVFVIPKSFFTSWTTYTGLSGGVSFGIRFDFTADYTVTHVNYLGNDYYPVNNKLLTYPFSFLQVSNHTGQIITYKWEHFNMLDVGTEGINFKLKGTITPGGSFKLFPVNYNNILNNNDDTINLGKYPIGAYNNDVYTNWLTQNGVNIFGLTLNAEQKGYVGGGLMTLLGITQVARGNPYGVGTISQGLGDIAATMQESYRHSLIPDSVEGNLNNGDVNFVFGLNNFEFKRMSIKNEYAKIIDKYFSMYGYKVNDLKLPNITGRANWNYVKTIGCNILGDIPQIDLQKIKDMFNNGVTMWHNPSTFLDYSQSNGIV